jgi:hypothetical protein
VKLLMITLWISGVEAVFGLPPSAEALTLAPPLDCRARNLPDSYCETADPQPWSDTERRMIDPILERIRGALGQQALARLESRNFDRIYRMKYKNFMLVDHAQRKVTYHRTDPATAWIYAPFQIIAVSDVFFRPANGIRAFSRTTRREFALLHEIMHAFDMAAGQLSTDKEFMELTGWQWNGSQYINRHVPPAIVSEKMSDILNLWNSGHEQQAYELDRTTGMARGFPSIYALTSPQECFAELGAYILFDENVAKYLPPRWIDWFSRKLGLPEHFPAR